MEEKPFFYDYIGRIEKIDDLLEKPVRSLAGFAKRAARESSSLRGVVRLPLYFPPWIASDRKFPESGLSATSALCCATLQRLWWRRRRFPRLNSVLEELEKDLENYCDKDRLPDQMAEVFLPTQDGAGSGDYVRFLNETGLLKKRRPLLACEALWILIHAGEGVSYSGSAFLSSFGVLWSLRHRPGPFVAGAAVGLAPPTAYITARCLLPVRELARACTRRANLLHRIVGILKKVSLLESDSDELKEKLPFHVDDLATAFFDYSDLSLGRSGFEACATELEGMAGEMSVGGKPLTAWSSVRERIMKNLKLFGEAGEAVVREAAPVADGDEAILSRIVKAVEEEDVLGLNQLGVQMPIPAYRDSQDTRSFWQQHSLAAQQALTVCRTAFRELREACASAAALDSADVKAITGVLETMEAANRAVAGTLGESIQESIQWCENVMLREIAQASAENMTEFDPAELVSGLAVAVYARSIRSPRRLSDAIDKALKGAREDGSWVPGRPFLLDDEVGFGEVAPTAGIVWMLSGAIARNRNVRTADAALARFVEWLEDREQTVEVDDTLTVSGWASERTRVPQRVDFWTTAFAINSLINIRGLMEFRLWEVCEQRFTVLKVKTDLSEIDAVDLGARHRHRLHSRLAAMSRRAEGPRWKTADYAIVLHGPPGSSKTALATAVAKQMWRLSNRGDGIEPRLVRITPADFTRGGEERLDSEARIIFDILSHVRNVTILFDEIDDLLRQRVASEEPTFLKIVVPAMLNRLQDLRDACPRQQIFFVLATNYIEKIEPALIRKGRIDYALPVVYPDGACRSSMVRRVARRLKEDDREWAAKILESALSGAKVDQTRGWPWLTLNSLLKDLEDLARQEPDQDVARREQNMQAGIEALVRSYKRTIPVIDYRERFQEQRRSVELLSEVLYETLARGEDLEEYRNALRARGVPDSLQKELLEDGVRLWTDQGRG